MGPPGIGIAIAIGMGIAMGIGPPGIGIDMGPPGIPPMAGAAGANRLRKSSRVGSCRMAPTFNFLVSFFDQHGPFG